MQKRFIETDYFPLGIVNDKSASEKTIGGRPPFWEMIFWWTRKPLVGARAVIAASLLPENASPDAFKSIVRLNVKGTSHRKNPVIPESVKEYFDGKKLLDSFAGFGSIPLEAMRLGLDATAVELLPTAYVLLKAVLEYPAKYGKEEISVTEEIENRGRKTKKAKKAKKLVYDVQQWGKWVTERLKGDKDIKELYDNDVVAYIGTWEVKCPHCQRWTPIFGNWWLARVKDRNRGFKRLAFMKPVVNGKLVDIAVTDINAIISDVSRVKLDGNIIRVGERAFEVPVANIQARRNLARCLLCGNEIKFVDDKGIIADRGDWYIKWALRKYHEGNETFARQRLFVKVKVANRNLIFEPCGEEDNLKLERAKTKIKELLEKGDSDIPTESISLYSVRYIFPILYGITEWYKLFNPRQLLTLVKLVQLIRKAGKKVEEEKIGEGWFEDTAKDYAEAVTTYLAISLCKFADYSSVCAAWNQSLIMGHTLSMRGIAMIWNFFEENPAIKWTGSWFRNLEAMNDNLSYLISSYHSLNNQQRLFFDLKVGKKPKILLDDATSLLKLNEENFDIIVTDPPYADDVPYTELSDFYYVWLKRALSDSYGKKLFPRFHPEAFFRITNSNSYEEIPTQWQEFAKQEISTNTGRFMDREDKTKFASKHFETLFNLAFHTMKLKLKEDGILVTYYAHTSPEAWSNLLYAGWKGAKMHITNTFPIVTESVQRVIGRGKMRLDTSIIVVWRDGVNSIARINEQAFRLRVIESAKNKTLSLLKLSKHRDFALRGRDILIGTMGAVLAELTEYEDVRDTKGSISVKDIMEKYVFPMTVEGMFQALAEFYGEGAKFANIEDAIARYYLLLKAFFGATANDSKFARLKVSPNELIMLKLATGVDASTLVRSKKLSPNITYLFKKSSSRSELTFFEPLKFDSKYLSTYLEERGVAQNGSLVINNAIDMFHYLGHLASKGASPRDYEEVKTYNPRAFDEARSTALILSKVLLDNDPEKKIADMVLGMVFGGI